MSLGVYHILALKPDDVVYCPLPLYHSAGAALGIGQAILSGISVVIRRKFSASQYFPDCVRHNCTVRLIDTELVNLLFACQIPSSEF
jgi:solute carrier family 27 fatty acid transporter 1/4